MFVVVKTRVVKKENPVSYACNPRIVFKVWN